MKFSIVTIAFIASAVSAFSPAVTTPSRTTSLDLFGGKKEGGQKGGMGSMMDQLAMFKKAQEIAQKKQVIENELKQITFSGKSSNDKVTSNVKYIPSTNPMDPQPEFEVQGFEFDDSWFEGASPEDISTACLEAYKEAVKATVKGSEEKFKVLAEDLQAMIGNPQKKD
jgi:DNA-binding protein YbaB